MDFIGSYYVPSSDPFPTPRNAEPPVFHELPLPRGNPDEGLLEKIKNGDFSEVRKLRKMGERRKPTVRFVAPACHDKETLVDIALTPKHDEAELKSQENREEDKSGNKEKERAERDNRVSIFGIKFGRPHNRR